MSLSLDLWSRPRLPSLSSNLCHDYFTFAAFNRASTPHLSPSNLLAGNSLASRRRYRAKQYDVAKAEGSYCLATSSRSMIEWANGRPHCKTPRTRPPSDIIRLCRACP